MYSYKIIIFDLDGTLFKTDTVFIEAIHETESVKNMLNKLKSEGYTLGVCTNGSREYVNKILGYFGINQYFEIIKSRVEGLEKFQLIKQILDENARTSAIIVGNSSMDFEVAEDVRCISIGVSYEYGKNDCKDFDFIANDPEDIYRIITKINGVYREVGGQILNKKQRNKPLIVGINGVDTSGKSTFTKELERYLFKLGFKIQTISIDDFHNPLQIRNKEKDPVISYLNNAFDIRKIENELMKPIVNYSIVDKDLLLLDIEKDEFAKYKRYVIDEDTIVLFEGVLLYREPLNQYFDLRIFIDISFDEVLKRATKRDEGLFGDAVIEKYNNKYIPIQKLYIEKHNPKELSDVVIDNNDYRNPQIIKQPNSNNIKSHRVEFEDVEEKHLYEIGKILEDDEAREMLGAITLPVINDYKGKSNIAKAIISENNEFIGVVELFNISWKNRRGELSITIKPQMRGKGYGYAAINKILEIAFLEHGINRIWLRVIETNTKAISLYKKVGFIEEGICRGESLRKGRFVNQIQMSILVEEWVGMYKI